MLDYTRTRPLNLQTTSFDNWLGQLLDEYETPDGIALLRQLDGNVAIAFDHELIRRILINLMDNACQAIADKDTHAIDGAGSEGVVSITTRTENEWLELIVDDTGCGIPPDERAQVFEPLYSTKNFGVGLGLSIVRQSIELHGGDVLIADREGEGTRFILRLPRGLSEDHKLISEPRTLEQDPSRRVLIVDENQDFADDLTGNRE